MSGGAQRRSLRRLAAVTLAVVSLWLAGSATLAVHADTAHAQPEVPTEPAPDERRTGPDPAGRPDPPTAQRVIDTAVWVWLVGCMLVAGVLLVRYVRRLDP